MTTTSPLLNLHEQAEADFTNYGPPPSPTNQQPVQIVATFGEIEAEYAAIRKSAALIDLPNRATITIQGPDAFDFLQRMLTNDMTPLKNNHAVRAFLLDRKGLIQGDLLVIPNADQSYLIDLDIFALQTVLDTLNSFIIMDDISLSNNTDTTHRLALHGPNSFQILSDITTPIIEDKTISDLKPNACITLNFNGDQIIAIRNDSAGEPGLELIAPTDCIINLHEKLLETGEQHDIRKLGWFAYNIARIENGSPLYMIDFGPDTRPHETGALINTTVSFTKGCYPGQEIVARTQNLGHPAKILIGLKLLGEEVPPTGTPVYTGESEDEKSLSNEIIGAITSATPSPMLGNTTIALAMLKYDHSTPETKVIIGTTPSATPATVIKLPFYQTTHPSR